MRWYVADLDYVKYLHSIDNKVEYIDYGDSFKPYFGIVYNIKNVSYYLPVSSPKSKHYSMKNSKDLTRIQ